MTIETEQKGQILTIKINRPEKRNAINDSTVLELERVYDSISSEIKCIIIHGEGKHFSAGLDLSELKERDALEGLLHSRMWHRTLDKIQFCGIPTIAVLHGACVGGGLEIALAAHIRIAEVSTFFALPEGQRGIFVGGGASTRLPKLIGIARMTDMMLTGRVYKAEEAENIGLVQYLVNENAGLEKGFELAQKVASNTTLTNFAITQVLPKIESSGHTEASMLESLIAALSADSSEAKKRLADFLEGRAKKVGE